MAQQNNKEMQKKWAQVLAKAWSDPNFKQKLLKNPEQALREMGIVLPANKKIEVHESTEKVVHLIIPPKPTGEIAEEDLKDVAGGIVFSGYRSD